MKIFICAFLLIVATVACETTTGIEIGTNAATENNITPPEYSKVNQDAYKTHAVTPITPKTPKYAPPPIPILSPITYKAVPTPTYIPPTKPLSRDAYSKPPAVRSSPPPPHIHKPTPLVKKVIEEVAPVPYRIYTVPRRIVQTYSAESDSEDKEADEYFDPESGPAEYQQEDYQPVPIGPTYAPPIAVYNAYQRPVIRRRYFTPAYENRAYRRIYNIPSRIYRTLGYGGPVAYDTPSVRSLAYGYPPQSAYGPANIAYDDGIGEIRYNGFINNDYDDYLKKKK